MILMPARQLVLKPPAAMACCAPISPPKTKALKNVMMAMQTLAMDAHRNANKRLAVMLASIKAKGVMTAMRSTPMPVRTRAKWRAAATVSCAMISPKMRLTLRLVMMQTSTPSMPAPTPVLQPDAEMVLGDAISLKDNPALRAAMTATQSIPTDASINAKPPDAVMDISKMALKNATIKTRFKPTTA